METKKDEKERKGWISIHRNILNTKIMEDSSIAHVFLYLLLAAAYEEKDWITEGVRLHLKPGQLVVGSHSCPKRLKMSKRTWVRCLKVLKEYGTIKTQIISGKGKRDLGTLVTIPKYSRYQSKEARVQMTPSKGPNEPLQGSKGTPESPIKGPFGTTKNKNNNKGIRDFSLKETEKKLYKIDTDTFQFTVLATGQKYDLEVVRIPIDKEQYTGNGIISLSLYRRDQKFPRLPLSQLNTHLSLCKYAFAKIQYQVDKNLLQPKEAEQKSSWWQGVKAEIEQAIEGKGKEAA